MASKVALDGSGNITNTPTPGWDPNSVTLPPGKPMPTGPGPTPPASVPKWGGGDKSVSVYTEALETFGKNLLALIPPIKAVMNELMDVRVEPGAFYDADKLRNIVNGPNGDGGLKTTYGKVLTDLAHALQTLHDETMTMSQKYKSFDEINTAGSTALQTAFSGSTGKFNSSITDNKSGSSPSGGG